MKYVSLLNTLFIRIIFNIHKYKVKFTSSALKYLLINLHQIHLETHNEVS